MTSRTHMTSRTQISLYNNLKNLLDSAQIQYAHIHKVKVEDVRPIDAIRAALEQYTANNG